VRAVVQRVRSARICVGDELVGSMGEGLLALVGVGRSDTTAQAEDLAQRLAHLRIFNDENQRMNRSLLETGGTLGLVSQFTLYGDARHGRRPSFVGAAPAAQAAPLMEALAEAALGLGVSVVSGRFQAMMDVELVNAGPVTILLDTDRQF
jgi:D-tyrosyl-tRNA(Tyr) deacylase